MASSTSRNEPFRPREMRPSLDPPPEEMRRLGYRVVDLLVEHLDTLSDQRVARRGTAAELAQKVDESLPRSGRGAEDCLRFFFERVVPDMTKVNHPRFHAFLPVPGSFYGALGSFLAAGTNPFAGSWLGAGTLASLELTVLRWIAEAVGYPSDAAGILTSGGSMANLTAIAAARTRFGRETMERGVLYFSQQGHESAEKAAGVLGYPGHACRKIAVDSNLCLSIPDLLRRIEEDRRSGRQPFFVCANAGTTNSGAVDPLAEVADLCEAQGLWFHVDAAYGGFAALCEEGRDRLGGMERADSLTLDPHKWLYSPMGIGCALVRDRETLEEAFSTTGAYLKDVPTEEVNFFNRGPELSRPGRVLAVWMLLRSAGLNAIARQIEIDLELARLAERWIEEQPLFEIAYPAQLSVLTFRHHRRPGEPEAARARRDAELVERALADGSVMISSTVIEDRSTLRFVVQNHRTDEAEIRRSVQTLAELAAQIVAEETGERDESLPVAGEGS